jgi:hypothetical protein
MTDTIVQIETNDTVLVTEESIEVVSFGIQGPPGASGNGEPGTGVWFGDAAPVDTALYPLWARTTNGRLYGLVGTAWVELTQFSNAGPQGPQGDQGVQGPPGSPVWGGITGVLSNQTDLQTALGDKASSLHNHDGTYSPVGHAHGNYSETTHNHDGTYSSTSHNHDGTYSASAHNHDGTYATPASVALKSDKNPAVHNIGAVAAGILAVDLANGPYQKATINGNISSVNVSNWSSSGTVSGCQLELTFSGAYSVGLAGWKFNTGVAPTPTANGIDVFVIWSDDAGTTKNIVVAVEDKK